MKNNFIKCLMYCGAPFLLSCQGSDSAIPSTAEESAIVVGSMGERIDGILSPYVEKLKSRTNNNASIAIGVVSAKEVIFAKTYGLSDVKNGTPSDLNTLYHIASISKPFTAVAICKLMQEEKLDLSDLIIEYIPELKMKGDGYDKITIQHILNHTSGIPRHISSGEWENPVIGDDALVKNLEHLKKFELDFAPGSEYNYSNSAFDILGIVVERASGKTFSEYMESVILRPVGMDQTSYKMPMDKLPKNWAAPHTFALETELWSPYPYSENYFPSSGVQSSLLDMCTWGRMHLGEGTVGETQVLDSNHFKALVTPYLDTPWGDKIGLSWFLQSYMDHPNIMHLGNDTGFEAAMSIYPEDDVAVIIMANRDFARTGRLLNATSEIIFGMDPKPYKISAKYKFVEVFEKDGINAAQETWEKLKLDTTDNYYTNDRDIRMTGALLNNEDNWQASNTILKYYTTLDDSSTYAWRLLGNSYAGIGDTIQALQCYNKALEIDPDYDKASKAILELRE